jgi:DNA-binding response OmpR family regulator/predicted regulator of Ras-like GTPase activity (Roadblock/LC7/MglB family)
MYNVLIVDEEEHLLAALEQNLFPERDDIAIATASDGETGIEKLKDNHIDLLISDIKMPGKIDGFQLILRAKEMAPDARVIIMTGFGNNRVQNFADRIGITHYIEKPFNTSELRDAILEILDEKEGFQGVLSDLELTDIIQMLCLARRTALLHLKHRDHRGRIVFDSGEVVHAEFDDLVGEDAVYRMLALRQGDIFMQSDFQNSERTIEIGWQDVLFEGLKRADEERAALALEESEAEEEADDDTSVGMGVSADEVDNIVQGGPDIDDEPEPEQSFFSEDELREIEMAGAEAIASESDDSIDESLPFATLAESSAEESGRFGVPDRTTPGFDEDDGEFRTPFQRERSAMIHGAAIRDTEVVEESVAEEAPVSVQEPISIDDLGADRFQMLLEAFARECPGLRQTVIIESGEGLALNSVEVSPGYDAEAIAAFLGDVAVGAERTATSLGPDRLDEVQLAVGSEYVLLRGVRGTPYVHVAVVERDVSLGVALVLMRRFQQSVISELRES